MPSRQPIVSVLGHVDHGKTTLLDTIRGGTVASREVGYITQHIGATEVPIATIEAICGPLLGGLSFRLPGLLFIDTPGHHSFATLRARGGALADIAVLIVDVMEGIMPQTDESIAILRRTKTPFIVAANKIDRINGWQSRPSACFREAVAAQDESVVQIMDDYLYRLIGQLTDRGFRSDRYDRIKDFRSNVAIVPIVAREGTGVADLLMVLLGLAQRFLESQLRAELGPGRGTVLELKEVRGLGLTLDVIVYDGELRQGDVIVVGTKDEPVVTRVKALLKPRPLDEIRDPRERFDAVESVAAASGVKVVAPGIEAVLAGSPLRVANEGLDPVIEEVLSESHISIDVEEEGVILRADAIGSLEALVHELKAIGVPIRSADVGDVSRRDVIEAATSKEPLHRGIVAFNVKVLPDAQDELAKTDVKVLQGKVIYAIVDEYGKWRDQTAEDLDAQARAQHVFPGKMLFLPDHTFRVSKPAVIGIRVLGGRVRVGQRVLVQDGRVVGEIKSMRTGDENLTEAKAGEEVAIALDGVTVGRQIRPEDVFYVDVPESDARWLRDQRLNDDEREVLEEIARIKRKGSPFWGM